MGVSPSFSKISRSHYLKSFGPFNQQLDIRNNTFILLDAPGLVDEDYQRSAYGVGFDQWNAPPDGAVSFVKTFERGRALGSLVSPMF
jgi:ethanolamine phosphate phosphodiesterase